MADDPGKNTADVPRPDTADTAHTAGGGDPSGNPDAPRGAPVPVPWYRRPLFCGIVLFLLVLALLLWLLRKMNVLYIPGLSMVLLGLSMIMVGIMMFQVKQKKKLGGTLILAFGLFCIVTAVMEIKGYFA